MEGNIEDWRKAGQIAAQALEYGKGLIKPGASLLEVSDKIEEKIASLGGNMAFPVQISCDNVAAHYCADPDDKFVFDKQVACLDVGVHVNGAMGDNACTVDLSGENGELVKASQDALAEATKILQIGVTLSEIGKAIEEAIKSHGFLPVRNLSGHGLGLYDIHCAPSIPNFDTADETQLKQGMTVAIEPFASTGDGKIYDTERANIFMLLQGKPVRSPITRQVLKMIEGYKGLPFTTRWLVKKFPLFKVNFALKELVANGSLKQFPPLPDKNGLVSQAENSFLIGDKVELLTKI
jgi:methionyl aminopeptidase